MARTDRVIRSALCGVATTVAALHLGLLAYLLQQGEQPRLADAARHTEHLRQQVPSPWQARLVQRSIEPIPQPTASLQDQVPAATPEEVPAESAAADDAPFLPRSVLSKAPKVLTVIDIPFPEGLVGQGNYRSTLALYIDETGVVRRVEVTGQALPPPLEEAARLTFMKASFTPGELGGHPVKARIVIEVSFDDSEPTLGQQAASTSLPAPV